MSKRTSLFVFIALVAFGIDGRLLPHLWNATPITAILLFLSAYIGVYSSLIAALVIMVASDVLIGFYQWPIMLAVYGSLFLIAAVGFLIKKKTSISIFSAMLASSILFFIVTNWAVWQFSGMYPHSFSGLIQCYLLALPFFKNSLVGDFFYTSLLFGGYPLLSKISSYRKTASA